MRGSRQAVVALVACVTILLAALPSAVMSESGGDTTGVVLEDLFALDDNRYEIYLEKNKEALPASDAVLRYGSDAVDLTGGAGIGATVAGRDDVLTIPEGAGASFDIVVPDDGMYAIELTYAALPGKSLGIETSLAIDGELPFTEAGKLVLNRTWVDEGGIERDNRGNDLRPNIIERQEWKSVLLEDSDGLYSDPFLFRLASGSHRITIAVARESLALERFELKPLSAPISYQVYLKKHPASGERTGDPIIVSAETPVEKSHPVLYPVYDRTSPATECRGEPNDPSKIRLNAIGGQSWRFQGQSITWGFDAPADGMYRFVFKARQNINRGMVSTRRFTVDGDVPYAELETIEFPYSIDWRNVDPAGPDGSYQVHLTKGPHEFALEVVSGRMAPVIRSLEKTVFELNYIYRRIIMITGTVPDPFRDYYLDQKIPGLLESFLRISGELEATSDRIEAITGTSGSDAAILGEMKRQLESLIEHPETIPQRLDRYKGNVSSLAAWLLRLREQPLEIDSIAVVPGSAPAPSPKAALFDKLVFDFKAFFLSFFEKYNAVGNVYSSGTTIDIWVSKNDLMTAGSSSGQDQAQVLKRLIDNDFVSKTGIGVNLSLVDSSQTLSQAILGGQGPDVALLLPEGMPVNLAMRGALAELSAHPDFEEVESRFFPSAWISYRYDGGVYAVPETQNYNMMFYRKDIFAELGVTPPETWDDFYELVPVLQKSNMEFGIGENQMVFESLIFQKGGKYYKDDLSATAFDSPEVLDAFKEWTGLYTKYGLPLNFDFYNRFRTGEMPIGITGYTFYNFLTVAAPELRNQWAMVPIPGTRRTDGTVNRTETCSGTACVIVAGTGKENAAWEFLKWWTGADAQASYGLELEYLIGPAARYDTANKEAFRRLPWSTNEQANLFDQWEQVWDIPQLPGNYITARNIQYAFRRVVYYWENERETLYEYNKDINKEIARKRREFGLD
jgi:ABC-type glycerol-3-phosphate transport system substrate-binding protein